MPTTAAAQRRTAELLLGSAVDTTLVAARLEAVTEDRARIAMDLHDTVIQRLFGEGLGLRAALVGVADPVRTAERIQTAIDGLDETIRELRMTIFSLHGPGLAPGGVRGRLLAIVRESGEQHGFEARVELDGPIEIVDDAVADSLAPVLREALANIARHAHARNVRVVVAVSGSVELTVCDDGVGVPDDALGGQGLANMVERARVLGGDCTIGRRAAGGTCLTWTVPLTPAAQDRFSATEHDCHTI